MSREAMALALEALENAGEAVYARGGIAAVGSLNVAAQALRKTLEEKREPVCWTGLTDEEIQDLSYLSQKIDEGNSPWFDRCGFARAVEQALKEKNHG